MACWLAGLFGHRRRQLESRRHPGNHRSIPVGPPEPDPEALLIRGTQSDCLAAVTALNRSRRHSHQATPPTTSAPPAICATVGAVPPTASTATATIGTRLV